MDVLDENSQGETHVFAYDNASTHLKRRDDALSARTMPATMPNLNHKNRVNFLCTTTDVNGKKTQVQMTGAHFADGTPQELYFPADHLYAGLFKGMKNIIQERREQGADLPDPKKLKAMCNKSFKCEPGATRCCCRRVLYTQPDFVAVKSALEELCESRGYAVIFFPKFHCELNFIEQCWGFSKRLYREYPLGSDDQLADNAVRAIDDVPLHSMRRQVSLSLRKQSKLIILVPHSFAVRSLRFMDAYRKGLNGRQAARASKKYRGHHVLPESIMAELGAADIA